MRRKIGRRIDDTPRPLTEHLEELRARLFWALGAWALCSGAAGYYAKDVFELLSDPAVEATRSKGHTLIAIAPPELLLTYIKSALLAGFVVSLPHTLYQAWAFVAPGLYEGERKLALPFVVAATLLFLAGCLFGRFVAFPLVFEYFLSLEASYVVTSWTMQNVFGFIARMYLAFGVAFELPVVILFLTLAGVVTPQILSKGRPYAIVLMFVIGAILTPPDVTSQILLAVPLVLLYEAGIWISHLIVRRRARPAASVALE
jgi:sec-independent protein translocase protein TatC